jgi:hypothetical protein
MRHLNIDDKCFNEMSNQYAKDIDNFLKEKCDDSQYNVNDEQAPEHIYYILKELKGINKEKYTVTPNLISISLKDMDIIIQEIRKVPG